MVWRMHIANIMLGGKRGGIEQALIDTSEALVHEGHRITAFIRKGAAIAPGLASAGITTRVIIAPYRWNLLGRARLIDALREFDAILLHGNRAASYTKTRSLLPPAIAVAHSRFFRYEPHLSAVIALSQQKASLLDVPCPVHVVPNLVRIPALAPREGFRAPPVIGAIGRLSHEKGFDLFIDALALLRARGVAFRAVIGGAGAEEPTLTAQIKTLGLEHSVTLTGWVADKASFFSGIDLFVMSSRTENFPITLLEAMAHGCPAIATHCGAEVILTNEEIGRLSPISAQGLADVIDAALVNEPATHAMGRAARAHAEQHYAMDVVGKQLSEIITNVAAKR